MPLRHYTLFFCLLLSSPLLHAQWSDTLKEVTITWPVLDRALVGQHIIGFDEASLRRFSQQNLAQLFGQQSAIPPRSYGIASALMSVRGGAASHTAIVWNGINLQNALSGYADCSLFPVQAFSDIRLKTGGESAMFGSGAMSGVVLLNNDRPTYGKHLNLTASAGAYRDLRTSIDYSAARKKSAVQMTGMVQSAQNNFAYRNTSKIGQPTERLPNARSEGVNLLLHGYRQLGEQAHIDVHGWWLWQQRQIPPTMTTINDSARQYDQTLRLTSKLSVGNLTARLAWIDELLTYESLVVSPSSIKGQTAVAEAESKWSWRLFKYQNVLQTGINYTRNYAISNNFDQRWRRDRAALFVSNTLALGKMQLGISARQERVDQNWAPLTGSAGFKRNISEKWQLRGSVARNYNLPAMNDLYWTGLGNPNLRAEKGWSGELGINLMQWRQNTSNTAIQGAFTVFHSILQDRIQWAPVSGTLWRPTNLPHSTASGFESSLNWKQLKVIGSRTWEFSSDWSYHYTYTRDENGRPLLYVPAHAAQATLSVSTRQWLLRWRQSAADGRPMTRDNQIRTEAYTLSDLELNWTRKALTVTGSVHNLFNAPYQVIQYYPMPGRLFNLQLQVLL